MLVLLTAAGAFVYWRVEYALDRGLDAELEAAADVIEPLVRANGHVRARAAADATGVGWQVLDTDGELLDSGGPAPRDPLVSESDLDEVDHHQQTFDVGTLLPITAEPYRALVSTLPAPAEDGAAYLVLGVRRDHRDEALRELLLQLTIAGVGALVVASLVGDVLARMALRPVERYRSRAAEITAGAATLRLEVPPGRDDEVTRLGHTLNEMLAALEDALDRERQFVSDASHELRTPLTLLKSRIQLARRRPRSAAEHEVVLDELAVDVTRLIDLAERLLELSHGVGHDVPDAGTDTAADLGRVAANVVRQWRAAHQDRAGEIAFDPPPTPVMAHIDERDLDRIVTNLLSNALLHGAPPVRLTVRRDGAHALLTVADAGVGMPAELLEQATRRFSRAPEARSRAGTGLGLAIVEQLVTAAHGELRLCFAGRHSSTGSTIDVPCRHDDRMTATVLLPAR